MRPSIKAVAWAIITVAVGLLGLFGRPLTQNTPILVVTILLIGGGLFYLRYREEKEVEEIYAVMDILMRDNLEFAKRFITEQDENLRCQIVVPNGSKLENRYSCQEMSYDDDITITFQPERGWAGEAYASNNQQCYSLAQIRNNPGRIDMVAEDVKRVPETYDWVISTPIRSVRDETRVIGVFNLFCERADIDRTIKNRCQIVARLFSAILSSKKAAKGGKSW